MRLIDENGLTEAEFLAQYCQKDYPRPSFTVDVAVFSCPHGFVNRWGGAKESKGKRAGKQLAKLPEDLRLLLVKRGGHPYLGCWALPGGFVNPGEDAETAAARELIEETGVESLFIEQFGVYSAPGRDPRGWTVSAAFIACLDERLVIQAGDDAADAQWCTISARRIGNKAEVSINSETDEMRCVFIIAPAHLTAPRAQLVDSYGFAFDHAQIIADALLTLASGR